MEDHRIPNHAISASSEYDFNHAAHQGRLNFKAEDRRKGGWTAAKDDDNQWIQVDLGSEKRVTGVAT